jgi:hypothetical protein
VLARLETDRAAVGKTDKEKFTDKAVESLSPNATDDQKAKAQELACLKNILMIYNYIDRMTELLDVSELPTLLQRQCSVKNACILDIGGGTEAKH